MAVSPMDRRALQRPREKSPASAIERDRVLVRRVLAGDRAAAIELYRMLQPAVDRTLRRILGRREADHDDLLQQSFEQIVRTLREERFSHACPLTAWAATITARVALSELRSRYRRRRHVDDTVDDPDDAAPLAEDWQHRVRVRDQVAMVRRELARLDPGHAWVVVLHDLEGHRLVDVAVTLGISLSAAQSRLFRGRRELLRRCSALDGELAVPTTEEAHR